MVKKKVIVDAGDIYFIPLFLNNESCIKSFSRYKFDNEKNEFVFFRVIEDQLGAGIMIEIFNFVGGDGADVNSIVKAPLLFNPIYISGEGIAKKRWRKVGKMENYDKERDSNYSSIKFLIGPPDDFRLWCNGEESRIDVSDNISNIEQHILWTSTQVEKRVLKYLGR